METPNLLELTYNGYKIYGLSRNTVERDTTLGTFVMFPGNNITVYLYFNNIQPKLRNFETLDDYRGQRNRFLGEYTSYLNNCFTRK